MNNPQKDPAAKALLQKYLDKTASPEEEQQVLRWYFSFNKEDDLISDEGEQEKILAAMKSNVLAATRKPAKRHFNSTWLQIAAMLAICFTAAFLAMNQRHPDHPVFHEFSTHAAQRKTITLSDGTRVWLNNASVLKYPAKFDSRSREVELEGEAFFEVAHNPKRPFLIHTHHLRVQVLGTSFNVRSYAEDKDIAVNVATGKVAVTSEENMVMLEKNEGVIYDRKTRHFSASTDDAAFSHAWQNGVLYFRYQTLENITIRLERWYGVKFSITNEQLKQRKYTLEQHHETLDNVMKVLSAGEFNYQITGRSVKIW